MHQLSPQAARPLRAAALFLLGAALFAAAYGQAPLYYSNQNQYFLHGLAAADEGLLRDDWLARTLDPTPVFSGLVEVTARFVHLWAFHVYHGLLLGAYAASLRGLFASLVPAAVAVRRWPVFVALLTAVHAAPVRWLSYRLLGLDYPWYFQSGVAGQYVLGAMLQPSVFGVLLIVAVCLFVRGQPFPAGLCVAVSATVHSTYLLPGALLTLGFLTALVREGRVGQAVQLGTFTLALVVLPVAYVLLNFGPTSPEVFAAAQDIVANFRIPHHARPDVWLDPIAVIQIVWIVLGLVLARSARLCTVLAVPFVLAALLTLAQVATGSNTLALLFPWRISAVLVPIATAVILSRLLALRALPLGGTAAWATSAVVVAALAAGGLWICVGGLAFRSGEEDVPVMDFVKQHRAAGDVYFVPVRRPGPPPRFSGSSSSDFKPAAAKKDDRQIIPVGLQRFRLYTGAPTFVDFKSIPYQDTDVIEWRRRIAVAEKVERLIREGETAAALDELRRGGVTHLVLPASVLVSDRGLVRVHDDPDYRVYRLAVAAGKK